MSLRCSYALEMRTAPGQGGAATDLVRRQCPAAALREQDGTHLSFAIPRAGLDLPALFAAIEGGPVGCGAGLRGVGHMCCSCCSTAGT